MTYAEYIAYDSSESIPCGPPMSDPVNLKNERPIFAFIFNDESRVAEENIFSASIQRNFCVQHPR